ncbi:hypothetical protein BGX24_002282 [Mortierella sp. AD032]|nr:hypothetical protein BGX24_002282 [Mortierella sp. AD032]
MASLPSSTTPKSLLPERFTIFRTLKSISKMVLHKFVGYLEMQALELIWKPCRSMIIAHT